MSQAMQLLNSLNLADYIDPEVTNDILTIDANGRITNVPNSEIILGVEGDRDVERKYFKAPRIVGDNVDLSQLSLRVHYKNANGDKDKYYIDDVTVDGDYITFSWLLSNRVSAYKGEVSFIVVAVKADEEGFLKKSWNTTLATGKVLEGLPVDDLDNKEEEQARDVVAQLLLMLESEKDASINEIQNKADEVLASIPADYVALDAAVKKNTADIEYLKENGGGGGGTINPEDLIDYVLKTEFEAALDEIIEIQEALIGGDE